MLPASCSTGLLHTAQAHFPRHAMPRLMLSPTSYKCLLHRSFQSLWSTKGCAPSDHDTCVAQPAQQPQSHTLNTHHKPQYSDVWRSNNTGGSPHVMHLETVHRGPYEPPQHAPAYVCRRCGAVGSQAGVALSRVHTAVQALIQWDWTDKDVHAKTPVKHKSQHVAVCMYKVRRTHTCTPATSRHGAVPGQPVNAAVTVQWE